MRWMQAGCYSIQPVPLPVPQPPSLSSEEVTSGRGHRTRRFQRSDLCSCRTAIDDWLAVDIPSWFDLEAHVLLEEDWLFNHRQICTTWPRFGSGKQICFQESTAPDYLLTNRLPWKKEKLRSIGSWWSNFPSPCKQYDANVNSRVSA